MISKVIKGKIFFRLDIGGLIGFGHLGRAEAMAAACEKMQIEPIFVIRKRPSLKNLHSQFKILWLDEIEDVRDRDPKKWINKSEEQEFNDFSKIVSCPSIVLVDHYGLRDSFGSKLKNAGYIVIGLHDYEAGFYHENMVVNYNGGEEHNLQKYNSRSTQTKFLLGLDYAPIKTFPVSLKKEFSIENEMKNIGFYLGGVPYELLIKALRAVRDSGLFINKNIRVIVPENYDRDRINKNSLFSDLQIEPRISDIGNFYHWCDLFIGSCGVSFLERAYLGLPQILFLVADNQLEVANYLNKEKLACFMGDLRSINDQKLKSSFAELKLTELSEMAQTASKKIDGLGAQRIIEAIAREYM